MKKLLCGILMLFSIAPVMGQTDPVKIVFDVTSDNVKTQQSAIRHVKMMSEAYPESQFEVVMYGGSINMVLADTSPVADDIVALSGSNNVAFKVCEGTMKRHEVDKSALLPGVGTVPDGIMELVRKQKEGWAYIKEGGN